MVGRALRVASVQSLGGQTKHPGTLWESICALIFNKVELEDLVVGLLVVVPLVVSLLVVGGFHGRSSG